MLEKDDFLFEGELAELDPDTDLIIGLEEERQARKLILIASESLCPKAVRDVVGSAFTNIYAEGYPSLRMSFDERHFIYDHKRMLSYYRRYSDRRYYKGVEYVDFVEALAQKRIAELFTTEDFPPERIYANVQPLSGAAANNAVYEAFLEPGDTVMGMALNNGGHLTHGSEANRSGKFYNIVSYEVSRATNRLDYDAIKKLAIEHEPKMIIAGYSAYPWDIDWKRFRDIADTLPGRAILLADIAHTAGLVVAGKFSNPIGYADAISFTTHKTLCGPRGAVILTTDKEKAKKIEQAVFPGEQGGPHICNIAAKAVCFQIAQTQKFKQLQEKVVENCQYLARAFENLGLKLAYGGTNTHMVLVDLKGIKSDSGFELTGEIASRILDLCGITINKNTIFGDENAAHPTAIRFGTTIVTQRGMGREEMEKLAELIHKVLTNIRPFKYPGKTGEIGRGKIPLEIMEEVKHEVAKLEANANSEPIRKEGNYLRYPHSFSMGEGKEGRETCLLPEHEKLNATFGHRAEWKMPVHYGNEDAEFDEALNSSVIIDTGDLGILEISGDRERVVPFLQEVATNDLGDMEIGEVRRTFLLNKDCRALDDVLVLRRQPDEFERERYFVLTNPQNTEYVKSWFRGLSDGYTLFDEEDIFVKVEGPVVVSDLKEDELQKTSLTLTGLRSSEIVGKFINGLENLSFVSAECEGVDCIALRADLSNVPIYTLLLSAEDAPKIWATITTLGAKPSGFKTWDKLRIKSGLSIYEEGKERPEGLYLYKSHEELFDLSKLYFIGQRKFLKDLGEIHSEKKIYKYEEKELEVKPTCLYEEHRKLAKKSTITPFAGWFMPQWYTKISDEHEAVRETAGLFDVSHMGALEIRGKHAMRFLDTVTTNYVPYLRYGQSHYSYILDPDGKVLDDVFIYCLSKERYMMIVNAVNTEKIKAWLNVVNSGEYLIDKDNPVRAIEGKVEIRDLKDKACGEDRKIDMALQGPNSLKILQRLTDDDKLRAGLAGIQKSEFIETILMDIKLIVSRTGYTGEELGFELYVHPQDAPKLWNAILEKGKDLGVKPVALGSRDSTRTEAGFPLYGYELAGPHDIIPSEAGYGAFVKFHKPFFIGRKAYIEKDKERKMEIVRFKMSAKGVKMVKPNDPVVNSKGEHIGYVTSSVVVKGYQVGMAYVDRTFTTVGSKIGIFSLPRKGKAPEEKPKDEMGLGDKTVLHEEAEIIERFLLTEEPRTVKPIK